MFSVVAMAEGKDLKNLMFVGLVALSDLPRVGVVSSVAKLISGGVEVKMITGDSLETAQAIGNSCIVYVNQIMDFIVSGKLGDIHPRVLLHIWGGAREIRLHP